MMREKSLIDLRDAQLERPRVLGFLGFGGLGFRVWGLGFMFMFRIL